MKKYVFESDQSHVIVTHDDKDGYGCKAVLEQAFPGKVSAYLVGNKKVSSTIKKILSTEKYNNSVLWITDVSPEEEMENEIIELIESEIKRGRIVIMFDHHKTASHLNAYEWADIVQTYDDGRKTAATSLLYDYLLEIGALKEHLFLKTYVEDVRLYDTWEWNEKGILEPKLLNDLYYIYGVGEFDKSFKEKIKNNPDSPFYFDEKEKTILEIEQKKINKEIENKSKKVVQVKFDDLFLGVTFAEHYISELGNELCNRLPFLDAVVIINMSNKKISFRTIRDNVDVSKLATFFKGGGHSKAAGCSLDKNTYPVFVHDIMEKPYIVLDTQNRFNDKTKIETYYENLSDKKFSIKKEKEDSFKLESEVISEELIFETFVEAEEFLKKRYEAFLLDDARYMEYLSKKMGIKETHLRSHYKQLIF